MNLSVEYIYNAVDRMSPIVKRMSSNVRTSMKDIGFYAQYYMSVAKDKLRGFVTNLNQTGRSMMDFGKKMKWISAGAGVGVWKVLRESMNFEDSQVMFETLIGSAERAKKLINDIDVMAKKTPMGNKILRQSTQTMLAYGMAVDDVMPTLRQLGDISGGNTERFKVLAYNISQVQSNGKLMGIDLKSLVMSGFNPLKIISEKTGISMDNMRKHMAAGNITFAMVQKAMKDATSEGGRFYKLMEKRNETAAGALDEFRDTFNQTMRDIGDELKPAFESITRVMISFLEKFRKTPEWFKMIAGWALVLGTALSPMLIGLGMMVIGLSALIPVIITLTGFIFALGIAIMTTPLGWIALAIGVVVLAIRTWNNEFWSLRFVIDAAWERLKIFGNWIKNTFLGIIDSISDSFSKMGEWINKLKFWKEDLQDDEMLEVNKNIKGIGGDSKFDIRNLLTIENKNNSELNYSPIKASGEGQSMAYGT